MAAALSVHMPTQKYHFSCSDIQSSSDLNSSAPIMLIGKDNANKQALVPSCHNL